jgi:hypothetical protein
MANRTFKNAAYFFDADPVGIYAAIGFNATGTPSLLVCDPATGIYTKASAVGVNGIKSIARNGVGVYTLTLQDTYVRLLEWGITFLSNSNAAAPFAQVTLAADPTNGQAYGNATASGQIRSGTPIVKFTCFSAQGTAADPGTTEVGIVCMVVQNGTAR